jgi:hypothetical protein
LLLKLLKKAYLTKSALNFEHHLSSARSFAVGRSSAAAPAAATATAATVARRVYLRGEKDE